MKKAIAILFLSIYATVSSGMVMHIHYCCGRFDGIDFSTVYKYKCPPGSHVAVTKKGCCTDKQVQIKIEDDQNAAVTSSLPDVPFSDLMVYPAELIRLDETLSAESAHFIHGPPLLKRPVQLYIYNCVFRI